MQSLLHLNFLIEKADEQRILQDRKVAIVMIVQQIGEKNPNNMKITNSLVNATFGSWKKSC